MHRQQAVSLPLSDPSIRRPRSADRSCAVARAFTLVTHHLPCAIRRQPHQPARLAHVRLTIRRRAFPIEPPPMAVPAPRTRRNHELLFRHQSCRCISSRVASRRLRNRLDRSRHPCRHPCGANSPPAATDNARMAAPSEPPDPARGTPTTPTVAVGPGLPTRQRTARSPECPRILLELSPDIDVVAIVGNHLLHRVLRAPEQLRLPQCRVRLWRRRAEPAAVVHVDREQLEPAKHDQRRSGVLPSSDRRAGHPPAGRPRRSVASGDVPHRDRETLIRIFRVDDAVGLSAAACSTPHRAHRAVRRWVVAPSSHFGQLDQAPRRMRATTKRNAIACGRIASLSRLTGSEVLFRFTATASVRNSCPSRTGSGPTARRGPARSAAPMAPHCQTYDDAVSGRYERVLCLDCPLACKVP